MRLQELDGSLRSSYGEAGSVMGAASGTNAFVTHAVSQTPRTNVDHAGNERSATPDEAVDIEAVQNAAADLQKRMEEQGVRLKFAVVRSERGEIEVEVTDESRDKVLMRIPSKGVLTMSAQGKTALGVFLNLHS